MWEERYLALDKPEKMKVVAAVVEAMHPYGLMIAGAVQDEGFPLLNSQDFAFNVVRDSGEYESDALTEVNWNVLHERGWAGRYRHLLDSDIVHRVAVVSHPHLPPNFSLGLAKAANDVKEFLANIAYGFSVKQGERYLQAHPQAKPIQKNFLGASIEGVTSVEQAMSIMWQVASQNGELDAARGMDDLLRITINMATGKNSFIHQFSRMLPFSSLVTTLNSHKAPKTLVQSGEVSDVSFLKMDEDPAYLQSTREFSAEYWSKHLPCPAVFTPTEAMQDRIGNSGEVELTEYAMQNLDVTSIDWMILAICKQIAYRENISRLSKELQELFDNRMQVLRDRQMVGVRLNVA